MQRSFGRLDRFKRPAKANLALNATRPSAAATAKHLGPCRPRQGACAQSARRVRLPCATPLLAGEGIETVLSLVTAVPGIHAAAALSAGSLGAFEAPQDLPCWSSPAIKTCGRRHAANRLQRRCVERGIPSIVIVPERSDFNDDLIAFGEETLAARIAPLIASTKPAATVEERRGSGRIITPS